MSEKTLSRDEKLDQLSPELRRMISFDERPNVSQKASPVSHFCIDTMRHCNGGKTVDAGIWLREFLKDGGRIFVSLAGAFSSFQGGVMLSKLIEQGYVAGISATGANMEESFYRLVAYSHYAYIRDYAKLTRSQEKQLDRAGYRRITDTFLPEEESVRVILDPLMKLWQEAQQNGQRRLWHEYFFELFERKLVKFDPTARPHECWLLSACVNRVPVFVPGYEDSTMGNIFSWACYGGDHPFLTQYKNNLFDGESRLSPDVAYPGTVYMHRLAEWYMDQAGGKGLAFLQLGGGIAGDFPICVVPHLKKDYLADLPTEKQDELIPPWRGFIEIHSSPMSYGSYSGAGGDEKITWSKVEVDSFTSQICGDYTVHFPVIAAIILEL